MHNVRYALPGQPGDVLAEVVVIVFDLDDTLYPEIQFVKSGFRAVSEYVAASGLAGTDVYGGLWETFCRGVRGTVFNEALATAGISCDEARIRKIVDVYRFHAPDIALYPDAERVLKQLCGSKKLGLLSDGYLRCQQNKVAALGIAPCFDVLVFTDALGSEYWKPHPAGYERIMRALGVSGNRCLYVGDNLHKDFLGARALGWKTVRIARPDGVYAGSPPGRPDAEADWVISSLVELVA
jgi:putative hydrolase of the HAD superfamily